MAKDDQTDPAVETGGWLRPKRYKKKWDLGDTTYWMLKKQRRIEVIDAGGGLEYVRDKPPIPTPLES